MIGDKNLYKGFVSRYRIWYLCAGVSAMASVVSLFVPMGDRAANVIVAFLTWSVCVLVLRLLRSKARETGSQKLLDFTRYSLLVVEILLLVLFMICFRV